MLPLLPAALLLIQAPGVPHTVEALPGFLVVQGEPDAATFAALKAAGVTAVVNFRTDAEGPFETEAHAAGLAGASYDRCPLERVPGDEALDAARRTLRGLPRGGVALLHCASGNRAAGALYAFLALDRGIAPEKALGVAKGAGLTSAATETAVTHYIEARLKK